jgi:hypothetical protein
MILFDKYRERMMGRLLLILGILLFFTATGYMLVMVGGAENEPAAMVLERVLCEDNETVGQHLGGYEFDTMSQIGGRSIAFFCADSEGSERDVTLGAIGIIAGGFAAQIILGLLLTFIGAGLMVRNRVKSAMSSLQNFTVQPGQATVFDLRDGSYQENQYSQIPPEKMEQVQQVLGQFGAMFGTGQGNLSKRLQDLEDARNKNLISESEYQRVRQAILDSLDD